MRLSAIVPSMYAQPKICVRTKPLAIAGMMITTAAIRTAAGLTFRSNVGCKAALGAPLVRLSASAIA